MTLYRVELDRNAQKLLRAILDRRVKDGLERRIYALADNPRPPGALKLVGYEDSWRLRVGDWRVIYEIKDERLVVMVVDLGPRGGVYR
jgi:mRNA interferase RelE/StbE